MNGIIAALFILMMFGGGRELADSTGYSYPSSIQVGKANDKVYQYISENPKRFIDWLYSHYFILDMNVWEKTDEGTYIKK